MHPTIAIALIATTVFCGSTPAGARHRAPGTGLATISYGKLAPDFAFETSGTQTSLRAFAGHPVVLNFWATWCAPCQDELATFARLRTAYAGDVVLIAVSEESREITAPFLHQHDVDALSVADPERKIFDRYAVTPLPVTLVIARDGTVTYVSVGELDWNELQTAIGSTAATDSGTAAHASSPVGQAGSGF